MEAFQCSACNFTTFEIEHLLRQVCVSASGKLLFFFSVFDEITVRREVKKFGFPEGKLVREVKAICAVL